MSRVRPLLLALPVAAAVVLLVAGCTDPGFAPVVLTPTAVPTASTPAPSPTASAAPAPAGPTLADLRCSDLVPLATIQAKFGPDVVPAAIDAFSYTINGGFDATSFESVARAGGLICDWNNGFAQDTSDYQGVLVRVLPDAAAQWAAARDRLLAADDNTEGIGDPSIAHIGDESSINCGYPDEAFPFCHDNVLVGGYWIAIDLDGVLYGGARGIPSAPIDQVVAATIRGLVAH